VEILSTGGSGPSVDETVEILSIKGPGPAVDETVEILSIKRVKGQRDLSP